MVGFKEMVMNTDSLQAPTDEEIAGYAYHLWESEGRKDGRDVEYWLQAKAHLTALRQQAAAKKKKAPKAKPAVRENQVATTATKEVKPLKARSQEPPTEPRAFA